MAINIGVPGQETFNQGGLGNLSENILNGLNTFIKAQEAANMPKKLEAELSTQKAKQDLIAQQILGRQLENKYIPQKQKLSIEKMLADIALQKAHAGYFNAGGATTGTTREYLGLDRIKEKYGADSPEYKDALSAYKHKYKISDIPLVNQITNAIESTSESSIPGINAAAPMINTDPKTGALIGPLGSKVGNVGAGIVDGNLITKPTTPIITKNQTQARANLGRELTSASAIQPYLGLGGSAEMAADYYKYTHTSDKKIKEKLGKKLVDAAVAERLVPELAAYQLSSQGVPATVHALQHQKSAIRQGWPAAAQKITENLPPELQQEVVNEHNRRLKEISEGVQSFAARGGPLPSSLLSKKPEKLYEDNGLFGYSEEDIAHTAKKHNLTREQVLERLRKHRG